MTCIAVAVAAIVAVLPFALPRTFVAEATTDAEFIVTAEGSQQEERLFISVWESPQGLCRVINVVWSHERRLVSCDHRVSQLIGVIEKWWLQSGMSVADIAVLREMLIELSSPGRPVMSSRIVIGGRFYLALAICVGALLAVVASMVLVHMRRVR